jgi:hypothetical protein
MLVLTGGEIVLRFERMFFNRIFALPLLSTAIFFFGAARFLPPVETGGPSIAVLAGYTNWLIPLIAILLAAIVAVGTVLFTTARNEIIALQLRMSGRTPWSTQYRHIVAACLLCVFAIAAFPVWSDERGYFGQRLVMMVAGERPYTDFEYAYGYLVAYLPYALHLAGLSIRASLIVTLCLFAVAGVVSFAFILVRCVPNPSCRAVLFWLLVACEAFVGPGPSLNYNFGRYAIPFVLLSVLTESITALNPLQTFAAFAGAVVFLDFISPEMALGFSSALLAWLVLVCRQVSVGTLTAGLFGTLAATIATPILVPDMFTTFVSYAQVQILLPVVPNLIMTLVIFAVLSIGAINFAIALSIWRDERSRAAALQLSPPVAYALLCAGLLPAVIGRSWPTITIAYGFVPVLMSIGYLLHAGAKRAVCAVVGIFAAFVIYSAQFGMRSDAGKAIHSLKTSCEALSIRLCGAHRQAAASDTDPSVARAATAQFLHANYPDAYDPLAILGAPQPGVSKVGYYVGLTDITTQQGLDRKIVEINRALYYILPKSEAGAVQRYARTDTDRTLAAFAAASLYPLPLHGMPDQFRALFIAKLYQECHEIAASGDVIVCRRID